jgi:hypothetical protein
MGAGLMRGASDICLGAAMLRSTITAIIAIVSIQTSASAQTPPGQTLCTQSSTDLRCMDDLFQATSKAMRRKHDYNLFIPLPVLRVVYAK